MRLRLVDRTNGKRFRIITNDVDSLIRCYEVVGDSYEQVGLVKFIWSMVFPFKRRKKDVSK